MTRRREVSSTMVRLVRMRVRGEREEERKTPEKL